jgi:hypothetical protein
VQGLLIEENRTNLLKYSEKMDESVYRRLNVDVTPNAAISPNNATEGYKLVADNNDDFHWFYQNVTVVSGTEHTFSIFVKAGTVTEVSIRLQALSGSADIVYIYDLALGTGNGYIESFPNGWYRLSGSFTPDTTSGRFYIFISGAQAAYEGNGASLYIWGAQLEEGSFPTSYIPTAGTQVTRAADNCVRVLEAEFNPNEFSFYLEAPIPRLFDDRNAHLIEFSDGSNNNRYLLRRDVNSTDLRFSGVTPANGVIFTMTLGIAALSNQTAKISASVSSTSATLVVDGVSVSDTVSDALPVVTQFKLGAKWDGSNSIGEAVFKDVQLYPEALSEAELITLTGGT